MSTGLETDIQRVIQADAQLCAQGTPCIPLAIGTREAHIVTGAFAALDANDWWLLSYRNRAAGVLRDVPVQQLAAAYAPLAPYRILSCGPTHATRVLAAVGIARANPLAHVIVHLGPSIVDDGVFTEALMLAVRYDVSVTFVLSWPDLQSAPIAQPRFDPARLADALGVRTRQVKAQADLVAACLRAARAQGTPTLVIVGD